MFDKLNAHEDLVPFDGQGICVILISGKTFESKAILCILMFIYTIVHLNSQISF